VSEYALELRDIEAAYGHAALVLRGLSLAVRPGEIVCLVGPNGAGKSTVLKVASGLLPPRSGEVLLHGDDVSGSPPKEMLGRGLVHVLQGHSLFPEMTVRENIELGGYTIRDKARMDERVAAVRELSPHVTKFWKTRAGLLSGGEQKIIEFARCMMLDPDVILLDEPSMGLDPRAVKMVLGEITGLRDAGKAVLLVEQNARSALGIADRGCVLDLGRVHLEGTADELLSDPRLGTLYLGGGLQGGDGQGSEEATAAVRRAQTTTHTHDGEAR
jgi:branched-chain amino acid transport system ATP-binding protein